MKDKKILSELRGIAKELPPVCSEKSHYRTMKRLYQQGKTEKVNEYIKAMNDIVIARRKILEELNKEA